MLGSGDPVVSTPVACAPSASAARTISTSPPLGEMQYISLPWLWHAVYEDGRSVVAVAVAWTRYSVVPAMQYLMIGQVSRRTG